MSATVPSHQASDLIARLCMFVVLSVLAGVLVAGVALPAVGLLGLTAKRGAENFQSLPAALQVPPLKQRSRLLAADGTLLATFYSQNRVYVPLTEVSRDMQDAIVAIEDTRFYEHSGIDLRGTVRALLANSQAGNITQGGSTLTQQYVKNVLQATAKTPTERAAAAEDSVTRKIRELRYALGLEQRWSKKKILEAYLNIAYFGSQAYGVEVAAQRYFSKPAVDLDLGEAATLAGLVKSPTLYDPLVSPKRSENRRNLVLQRMADLAMVSQTAADRAMKQSLEESLNSSDLTRGCAVSKVPFFCDYVQQSIMRDPAFGKTPADRRALLNGGGLTIRTTLDMDAQRAAQESVNSYIPIGDPSERVAAIAMIQPGTGNIVAMAQNLDYGRGVGKSYINNVVDESYSGTRGQQAGSTFKIFTIAAAIESGFPINQDIYAPPSRVFPYGSNENCNGDPLEEWPMENYTGSDSGYMAMREAAAFSVNTYFAELQRRVGLCKVADIASRAGMHSAMGQDPIQDIELQQNPFTLGAAFEISPLALAESYATFAARGLHCLPRTVQSISTRDDTDLAVTPPDCTQTIEPEVADAVNSILKDVIDGPWENSTGAAMTLGRPAAGKTGTTDNNLAVWFAGYTPDLAAAVWAGHPDAPADNPMRDITIGGQYYPVVYGRSIPGPIWQQAMLGALEGVAPSKFTPINPALIDGEEVDVPTVKGMIQTDAVRRLERVGFVVEVSPFSVASIVPRGRVAYTSPGAGAIETSGSTVTVYISNGVTATPTASPSNTSASPAPSPSSPSGTPSATQDQAQGQGQAQSPQHGQGHGNGNGHGRHHKKHKNN